MYEFVTPAADGMSCSTFVGEENVSELTPASFAKIHDAIRDRLKEANSVATEPKRRGRPRAQAQEGNRNTVLTTLVADAVEQGIRSSEIMKAALETNAGFSPPLEEVVVRAIVAAIIPARYPPDDVLSEAEANHIS